MHILYVTRLFSGIEEGLIKGEWAPRGVPTICKMVEALDNSEHSVNLIFTSKGMDAKWNKKNDVSFAVKGLSSEVTVLANHRHYPKWLGRLREKINWLRQVKAIYKIYKREKPDIVYFDRGNIFAAALWSRYSKTPVVWRVMGVLDWMKKHLVEKSIRASLYRWAYKSPFACVICSFDGSGGKVWMEAALDKKVERHILLNGVDKMASRKKADITLSKKTTNILFVSRLETIKGVNEFIDAIKLVAKNSEVSFVAHIVGDGSQRTVMEEKVKEYGVEKKVKFYGALLPAEVRAIRLQSDIYVSLNKQGNLSNANLEALADGLCIILPEKNEEMGIDIDTHTIITNEASLRFGKVGDTRSLANAILKLLKNKNEISKRKEKSKACAKEHLRTWQERVSMEIAMLEEVTVS